MEEKEAQNTLEWPFELFAEESLNQCIFSLISYDDLISVTKKEPFDNNRFWHSIHGFLVNVGNISKLLNLQVTNRGRIDQNLEKVQKSLQKYFNINPTSLIANRKLRNHFEHYDERLYEWANNSQGSIMVTYHIGSVEKNLDDFFIPDANYKIFKRYDPETYTLEFKGDCINLDQLSDEVLELKNKLEEYFSYKERWHGININQYLIKDF